MDAFTPFVFTRHTLPLRTVMQDGHAWLCVKDLGRLMGLPYPERRAQKLDTDQVRHQWLQIDGQWHKRLLVSESGALALMIYHHAPENRALRYWLTHEVLPVMRSQQPEQHPSLTQMSWQGVGIKVLYWQDEPWVRMRDMPQVLPRAASGTARRGWRSAFGVFRTGV
ncbi:MAG: Bro-N domain-containing protein [Pseudomonas sp.]|uniref:BRO-N domain-containing protein n=1 Tax=Pseudomonas abieticivorans TaxID=2931382 RepID=UPI0020BF2137|nr:Bro-N domain-containing protein [Pseudomonas sp. PIA16]MDE1169122.1 Bro-N domain-containing protein [Pseudomonas sp.]